LIPPFKKGLLCVAKFSVDGNWYRARITRELKNKYEVIFIDYGNVDVVYPNDIRKMQDNLVSLPS
jgi:staphylococcal nuclease domain-containing protein 1